VTTPETLCVTYAFAYVQGETTLCAECAELPDETPLGEVRHGEHLAVCDACDVRAEAEEADARRAEAEALDATYADAEAAGERAALRALHAIGLHARLADAINASARQDGKQVTVPIAPEDFDATEAALSGPCESCAGERRATGRVFEAHGLTRMGEPWRVLAVETPPALPADEGALARVPTID
jgi:hypothetical protein